MNELKEELIEIQNKYLFSELSHIAVNNMNNDFTALFDRYLLSDIKFRIVTDIINQKIHIEPMREIDRYAIRGILKS